MLEETATRRGGRDPATEAPLRSGRLARQRAGVRHQGRQKQRRQRRRGTPPLPPAARRRGPATRAGDGRLASLGLPCPEFSCLG